MRAPAIALIGLTLLGCADDDDGVGLRVASLPTPAAFDPRTSSVELRASVDVLGRPEPGRYRLRARFELRQGGGIPVRVLSDERAISGPGPVQLSASWDGTDTTGRRLPSDAFEALLGLRLEALDTGAPAVEVFPERGLRLTDCSAARGCVPVVSCATADDDPARCAPSVGSSELVCALLGGLVPPQAHPGWNFSGTGPEPPIDLPLATSAADRYPPNAPPGGNADNPLVVGTDLGSPFEHTRPDGTRELVFLFGDTKPLPASAYAHDQDGNVYPSGSVFSQGPANNDSMAISLQAESDPPTGPERCLDLDFFRGGPALDPIQGVPEHALVEPVTLDGFLEADTTTGTLSGVDLGYFRVPGSGFSLGGRIFAVMPAGNDADPVGKGCDATHPCQGGDACIAGACFYGDCTALDGSTPCFKRNADATLATSPAGDTRFRALGALEHEPAALDVYRERSDIMPLTAFHATDASHVFAWGRPRIVGHPQDFSEVVLWKHQLSASGLLSKPVFFRGCADDPEKCDSPEFVGDPAEATRLFEEDRLIVNQTSVTYLPSFGRWVMIYGGRLPLLLRPRYPTLTAENAFDPYAGIYLRTAPHPWGPWSSAVTIYDPYWSNVAGNCEILFQTEQQSARIEQQFGADFLGESCDSASELQTFTGGQPDDYGAEYGSAIVPRFATDSPEQAEFFWLMSTWNPYRVVLMKTTLTKRSE